MASPFPVYDRRQKNQQEKLGSAPSALELFRQRYWFVLLLVLGISVTGLYAQVQNGAIQGTVNDREGAIVPGSAVTLTQVSTNLVLHDLTNDVGAYSFPQLQPGEYSLAVEKAGFKKSTANVTLTVGQVARLDFSLQVGSETQTVTIEANNQLALDTQTSNLDYTVPE